MDTAPEYTNLKLLTAVQIAELWNTTPQNVYRQAKLGVIPCIRINGAVRFREADLTKWINEQAETNHD